MSGKPKSDWDYIGEMESDLRDITRGLRAIMELGTAVHDNDVSEAIIYIALQMRSQAANLERLYYAAHDAPAERGAAP